MINIENILYSAIFFAITLGIDFKLMNWKNRKEKVLYLSIIAFSFTLIALFSMNVKIPSPSIVIMGIIEKILKR